MKQLITLILALLLTYNLTIAQDTMYVHQNGGILTQIAINKIDSIIFYGDTATAPIYAVGDSLQGGIIAYILQTDDIGYVTGQSHGIIAALSDQSSSAQWYSSYPFIGATATAIGAGNANTNSILVSGSGGYNAAWQCWNINQSNYNGYNDWYLPSKDELNKLYINNTVIGGFVNVAYWSSSEVDDTYAWRQSFLNGYQSNGDKLSVHYVRCVRSF